MNLNTLEKRLAYNELKVKTLLDAQEAQAIDRKRTDFRYESLFKKVFKLVEAQGKRITELEVGGSWEQAKQAYIRGYYKPSQGLREKIAKLLDTAPAYARGEDLADRILSLLKEGI